MGETVKEYYSKQNDCKYYLVKSDYRLYMIDEIITLLNNYHMLNNEYKNKIKELEKEHKELMKIIENQGIIIQEIHLKLMEYELEENPIIKLTKEDLEMMGSALKYYVRE